jgi:hypothetical protein
MIHGPAWAAVTDVDGRVHTLTATEPDRPVDLFLDLSAATVLLGGPARAGAGAVELPLDAGVAFAATLTARLAEPPRHTAEPPRHTAEPPRHTAEPPRTAVPAAPLSAAHGQPAPDADPFASMLGLVDPPPATGQTQPPSPKPPLAEPAPPDRPTPAGMPVSAPVPARHRPTGASVAERPGQRPAEPLTEAVAHTRLRPADPAARPGVIGVDDMAWAVVPSATTAVGQPSAVGQPVAEDPPRPGGLDEELVETTLRDRDGRPTVPVVDCPHGHPNPPGNGSCRVCGVPVPAQQPRQASRPALGVLRLPDGETIPLDRGVILGRAPGIPAGGCPDRPHHVKLQRPYPDISRRHLEIRLDGWDVLAVDLESRNGTTVQQPDESPVTLPRGGSLVLRPGAVIVLTDEVVLRFEVTG